MAILSIGAFAEELYLLERAGYGNLSVFFDFDRKKAPEGFGNYQEQPEWLAIGSGYDKGRPWRSELPLIEAGHSNPDIDCCTYPPKGGHTVLSLRKAVDVAKRSSFEGCEGGLFQMEPDTPLIVSDYDEWWSGPAVGVGGLRAEGDRVIILTYC